MSSSPMPPTPPILTLIQCGNPNFPRFIIAKGNSLRNPVYWDADAETWVENESEATIYANQTDALWEHHRLTLAGLQDQPCHAFAATIYIDIYGKKPDLKSLSEWLERAARLVLNSPQYGNGPIEGCHGVIVADFSKVEEIS